MLLISIFFLWIVQISAHYYEPISPLCNFRSCNESSNEPFIFSPPLTTMALFKALQYFKDNYGSSTKNPNQCFLKSNLQTGGIFKSKNIQHLNNLIINFRNENDAFVSSSNFEIEPGFTEHYELSPEKFIWNLNITSADDNLWKKLKTSEYSLYAKKFGQYIMIIAEGFNLKRTIILNHIKNITDLVENTDQEVRFKESLDLNLNNYFMKSKISSCHLGGNISEPSINQFVLNQKAYVNLENNQLNINLNTYFARQTFENYTFSKQSSGKLNCYFMVLYPNFAKEIIIEGRSSCKISAVLPGAE